MCSGSRRIRGRKLRLFVERGRFFTTDVCVCVDAEWWDRDVNGFTETDFIQNFRMSGGTFNSLTLLTLAARRQVQAARLLIGRACVMLKSHEL